MNRSKICGGVNRACTASPMFYRILLCTEVLALYIYLLIARAEKNVHILEIDTLTEECALDNMIVEQELPNGAQCRRDMRSQDKRIRMDNVHLLCDNKCAK